MVLEEIKKRGLEVNPENEKLVRESLREEYGMSAMAKILLPRIEEVSSRKDTVLDGLYSWDEYVVLKEKFGDKLKLISIVADKNIRYERVGQRKIRPLKREKIEARDIAEIENLAKGGPIAFADYFILNNFDKDTYLASLKSILERI